jgi:hypothetical protein
VAQLLPDSMRAHLIRCSQTTSSPNETWSVDFSPFEEAAAVEFGYFFTNQWTESTLRSSNLIRHTFSYLLNFNINSEKIYPIGSSPVPSGIFSLPITPLEHNVQIHRCRSATGCSAFDSQPLMKINDRLAEVSFFYAEDYDRILRQSSISVSLTRMSQDAVSRNIYLGVPAPNGSLFFAWWGGLVPVPGLQPRLRRLGIVPLPSSPNALLRLCFFSFGEEVCFRNRTQVPLGPVIRLERE